MNQLRPLASRMAVASFILVLSYTSYSQSNYALSFDGTDDYVSTSSYLVPTSGDFTVELWAYATNYTGYQEFVSQGSSGTAFYIGTTSGSGVIRCGDNWLNTGITMPLNQWVHVALVKLGGSATLYLNGIQKATLASGYSISPAGSNFQISTQYGGLGEYFNGKIDELKIWNTARTAAEIKANMFNRNLSNSASGLVAYYRMNDGSGTTATNSCTNTSSINGTLTNGPAWVSSPVQYAGNALSFDGTNDYVNIPDDNTLDLTTAITLEAWVYATKNSGIQNVISKSSNSANNGYIFPRTDDGWAHAVFYLHVGGGWQTVSAVYPSLNAWHHLAATYDGVTMKLYIDGVLAASKAQTGTITTNANPLALGNQTGFSEYFGGYGDEFRVWNVARSQTQIQNSMNIELDPALQTGLVSYYNANQGSASGTNTGFITLPDQKANNNGTLTNFSLSGAISNFVTQNSGMFVLPLKWISFIAQKQNNNVILQWSTASETNANDFQIEHSVDGKEWKRIGSVLSNNTPGIHNYSYKDAISIPGINYYRIRQNDRDGKYSYSVIRTVKMNDVIRCFEVIGNPVINKLLQVQINIAIKQTVILSSSDGKLIWTKELSPGMHAINLSNLAKGIYILSNSGYSEKLVVQ